MFKKSNRNFRAKRNDSESENEKSQSDDDRSNPPPPAAVASSNVTSQVKQLPAASNGKAGQAANSLSATTKTQVRPTQPILSFDDLEGDSRDGEEEEFRVKKSKESRRIAKELKKAKKERERQLKYGDSKPPPDSKNCESAASAKTADISSDFQEDAISDLNIKFKPLKRAPEAPKSNESDTKRSESDRSQSDGSEDEETKLRKLREEIAILNGDELDPIENESDETKRSMKLMLRNGIIPDASVIFAARKKREMARQEEDFIPVGKTSTTKFKSGSKSRIVREDDENDFSDEESAVNSRLNMNYIEAEKNELRANRENFLAYENGDGKAAKVRYARSENSDEDMSPRDRSPADNQRQNDRNNSNSNSNDDDSEEDRWEKEQIRKGVLISQTNASNLDYETSSSKKSARKIGMAGLEPALDSDNVHFDMSYLNSMPKIKFAKIKESLKEKMAMLNESLKTCKLEAEQTELNLKANRVDFEKYSKQMPALNEQYIYFQQLREKLTSDEPVECTEELIKEFKEAKAKWLALVKQQQ